ncbi:MAG TPA: methylenetetrahydrofolate--tRNA-(uracil(54)-C(5))-methyltransferase (FADH(2)-oxidizing) TrmFO [Ruminococcus sp.]|nr:methylenetetrahydrofolate--tRNA-(uracil(54)-C(5))-methyltransferase (FADH(2)-oxidizing) TrmFO [Ruminococcus sp.]
MIMYINVIGAGLAGCEAAMQIASRKIKVKLFEMKPKKKTPAHHSDLFGELVCSNSLKAARVESAAGLLKEEMRHMNSFLMKCADKCRVPAGGALAVDREIFSQLVTDGIRNNSYIEIINEEITEIPNDAVTIVASGPLTSDLLAASVQSRFGESLSFFDAAAPIVTADSIDMDYAFCASRYGKGDGDDYINCPMNKEEYEVFYESLISAERAPLHDFDVNNPKVYEGCMPVEVMAQRGHDTLRFGPMKPVGLTNPKDGHRPWAVLQLRKENASGSMYNLVGFQTNLKFGEQKRVFSLIPALHNADFVRYGVMHRNTFICSPKLLSPDYSLRENKKLFFAGQITGVEGYMESASSGILAGINACRVLNDEATLVLPNETMIGSLAGYISDNTIEKFQPMGANLGILPALEKRPRDKKERAAAYAERSLRFLDKFITDNKIEV